MFIRNGKYYFMWSEGGWTGPDYSVAYAMADSPFGPFKRIDKILQQNSAIATGAGHHSVIHFPNEDEWYIVYHRFNYPNGILMGRAAGYNREVCIDKFEFNTDDSIKQVKPTHEGIKAVRLKQHAAPAGAYKN